MNGNRSLPPAPDIDADPGHIRRLRQYHITEEGASFDQQQLQVHTGVRVDGHTADLRIRKERAGSPLGLQRLHLLLQALPDQFFLSMGPCGHVENIPMLIPKYHRAAEFRTQHLHDRSHRQVMSGQRRHPRQTVGNQ